MSKPPVKPNRKIKTLAMPPEDSLDIDEFDAAAVRALLKAEASPEQQQRGMRAIIEKFCMAYQLSYRPDSRGGQRASDFLEGRRAVGQWLINLQHMSPKQFEKDKAQ